MKQLMPKVILSLLLTVILITKASAQNWQYVGSPYIHQNNSTSTFLYFGDMEMNAAGDLFAGYWEYSGVLNVAKYSSGTWSQLPSPGTFAVSTLDVEVQGSNYYLAYSGVRGANSYAWVRKFDGTTWQQLGDSVLLGNSGSGGWFEFVLDNNEVPTLMGVVSAPFADKQIMQYTGGSWTNVITLTGTNATIFRENSAIFDGQNKLLVVTQGLNTTTFQSYNLVNKIDAGVRTTVGDTLFTSSSNSRIKLDATGVPYVIFNAALTSKVLAYKLNGSTWSFIADTTGTTGSMLNADMSGTGKVVFNTLNTPLHKNVYFYENNTRVNMDSVNINGILGGIQDLLVPSGTNEVYALALEIKANAAQDFSVIKHDIVGTNAVYEHQLLAGSVIIYPNPARGSFTVEQKSTKENLQLKVYSMQGVLVHQESLYERQQRIDLSSNSRGSYLIQVTDGVNSSNVRLVLQ